MMNIDEILNYSKPRETYYDILGCHQSSTIEQISTEYKLRALKLHPDKNKDPASLEAFRKLQSAKEVLADESSRRSYDVWLDSNINIPFEQWQSRKAHANMHWAPPRSGKLGIQANSSTRQGSDLQRNEPSLNISNGGSLLEKFRKYEI